MEPEIIVGVEFLIHRIACLLVGLAFCSMAYRLFLEAIHKGGTESESNRNVRLLKVGTALPGAFFSLIGAAIVLFAVFDSTPTMTALSQAAMKTAAKAELPENLPKN